MRINVRCAVWLLVVCPALLLALSSGSASARDTFVKELLLSLARPGDIQGPEARWSPELERILSGTRSPHFDEDGTAPGATRGAFVSDAPPWQYTSAQMRRLLGPEAFFPGSLSLRPLEEGWVRVASLGRDVSVIGRQGSTLLDSVTRFSSVGSKVGDPRGLYSYFEIGVDKSRFTVELFGVKSANEKTLLFSCRAGLGSPEYPTPRGTFYIVRIFDDRPLWIPPNTEWAWGQLPSHAVYGGHMMPLFVKTPLKAKDRADETVADLDLVESEREMRDSGGYRVHGTNSPWSVGSNQSHGCVRLVNKSVKQLADTLKLYVGTIERGRTANGSYVTLERPVRLVLY